MKTTWLRQHFSKARWFNLLEERVWSRLLREPGLVRQEVDALPVGTWVVVDEVQRLPELLHEVHDVLSHDTRRVRFALTGSSARKLRSRVWICSPAVLPAGASLRAPEDSEEKALLPGRPSW